MLIDDRLIFTWLSVQFITWYDVQNLGLHNVYDQDHQGMVSDVITHFWCVTDVMNHTQGGFGVVWRQWRTRSASWLQRPFPSDSNHVATSDNMEELSRQLLKQISSVKKAFEYSQHFTFLWWNFEFIQLGFVLLRISLHPCYYSLKPHFHCYHGNWAQWGQSGFTKKTVTPSHFNVWMICQDNDIPPGPKRALKFAIQDFQVTMAAFSKFYEFWFIVSQRPIFLPNFTFLALTVAL